MDFYSNMAAVAVVSLLAAISPGPDFFIVLKNSLIFSRKNGMATAVGVSTALFIHLAYTLIGIGILIAESPWAYGVLKYVGAIYLFYIGTKGIIGSFHKNGKAFHYAKGRNEQSFKAAFLQGFLTNLLNPKCALFFISLFSQFITPATPAGVLAGYAGINWSVTLGWFLFLSYLVTCSHIEGKLSRFKIAIERVMGSALVILGLKLLVV